MAVTPNQRLTEAMAAAGITPDALADLVDVGRSSVYRWQGDAELLPRLSQRLAVAKVLSVPARDIWNDTGDGTLTLSATTEWPGLTAVPRELWADMFRKCTERFDVCVGGSMYIAESNQGLFPVIAVAAEAGEPIQVRILAADPDGTAAAARQLNESQFDPTSEDGRLVNRIGSALDIWTDAFDGLEGAEVRITDDPAIYTNGVVRFDDRMLVFPYIYGQRTLATPTELLRRYEVGGRFDAMSRHVDRLWETGTPYTS